MNLKSLKSLSSGMDLVKAWLKEPRTQADCTLMSAVSSEDLRFFT